MITYKKTMGLLFSALLICGPTALHAGTSMHMHLEKGLLSVDLKDVPLKQVLQYVQDSSGIWVLGDESLLDEAVSTNFEKMHLVEGLRRILFSLNHAMVFDGKGNLTGVFLAGRTLAESGDRIIIMRGGPIDSPAQDRIVYSRGVPDNPEYFGKISEMPDDNIANMQLLPAGNMGDKAYMEGKDPGAQEPRGGCPGAGMKPETGPEPDASRVNMPPRYR